MIIVDGVARLVDIENFVLGVPSFYRPFFVQHSKINTSELIDVYSFGHLLYELTFGYPLQESVTRQPIECSSEHLSMFHIESLTFVTKCLIFGFYTFSRLVVNVQKIYWNRFYPKMHVKLVYQRWSD